MDGGALWGPRACGLNGVEWGAWVPEVVSIFSAPVSGTSSLGVGTQSGFH